MRIFGFREKNELAGKLQGGPGIGPPCIKSSYGGPERIMGRAAYLAGAT
jgi:hypothetical protein